MTYKLESRFPGEISTTSDMQMIPFLMAESEKELKSLLMKVKGESEKAGLNSTFKKPKNMASGPITSWQIEGGKVEAVTGFIFLGSKISVDWDCSHEMKRCLPLVRKAVTNHVSILKKQRHHFANKGCLVKAMVFLVVMSRCESWTIKRADHRKIDAFKLCWRRLLRVTWTARSSQSILKETSAEYSFRLMLKLKLQYFGHLMGKLTHRKQHWCWERLTAGAEGGTRRWVG